ncbi:prominin-1-A isoform X2 [Homalodisca vitripennis]|uniref:prominin-1-A isoform X2 n=1 Tax=Homalodisca vitripennis TaxID=197043 RepID=UPI001EEB7635|nr:prominin-1-A isoform X2 [Homalodisca vitripennis]
MVCQFKCYIVLVLFCLNFQLRDICAHARLVSVFDKDHCLDETHEGGHQDKIDGSKQEDESDSLNNDRVTESSSKSSVLEEVIESIANEQIYEESGNTTQYEKASYVIRSQLPERGETGGGAVDVYDLTSPETPKVLGSDNKDGGETYEKPPGNKHHSEINFSENKSESDNEFLDNHSIKSPEISKHPDLLSSDVRVQGFMKSHIDVPVDSSTISILAEQLTVVEHPHAERLKTDMDSKSVNPPEKLTMEETIGSIWKEGDNHDKYKQDIRPAVSRGFLDDEIPTPLKLVMDEDVSSNKITELSAPTEPPVSESDIRTHNISVPIEQLENTTENSSATLFSTTGVLLEINKNKAEDVKDIITELKSIDMDSKIMKNRNENETFSDNETRMQEKELEQEKLPVPERYYAFNLVGKDDVEQSYSNRQKEMTDFNEPSQSLRDYEDSFDEYKEIVKRPLNDYETFSKKKNDPGVLFEDCPDCDLRLLPIRPSEQRIAPDVEEETLTSPKIRFAELPEGRDLQINSLGLSDGIFVFSYLSEFLSWIQPNEFPVELLRDALKSQITLFSLIMQSLRVEAGFVACLVLGVLLALAVPVVVLSHACYRMGGREDEQEAGGNCGRRTLVFILELLLILMFAGMVAMFVTNEQFSSAVVQSSNVLQTSLSDVSAFVHNSHLQLHFLVTQSIDQTIQAIFADLDNVDSLLGRPIQREMVRETGIDVALDSLSDLTREAKTTTQQVERFLDDTRLVQEMLTSSRDKLSDLRQQVELFRRACGPRDRMLCDTIDASGLDITLQLNRIKADERLNRMRRMGGVGLELAVADAKEHFVSVPTRVESETRDAREAVRRQLNRQRADVDDKSRGLEQFARDVASKVSEAKYDTSFWMQDLDQFEYWRWIICMGGGAAVLMIWTMLLCSMCCGCCGSEKAAGPTILVTIVLVCLFTTALWTVALVGMLVGGHGEVFVCRPLYDEPEFHVISRLVDQPGVFYSEPRGGFIANVLYGNDTLDVPIKQLLEDCHENRAIYPTMGLHRLFDIEAAVDQHRWDGVSTHLRAIRANLSSLEVLSPVLQDQLADLLTSLSVNFTEHRIQMSKPVTGKDLDSFAKQLDNIGNQMRDLATASRMETLSSRARRLIDTHIRPLEGKKDNLVYQLTALEVQTGPLQRQVNQSLSHLKTIQFFVNSQGETIAQRKSREYVDRLLSYLDQLRDHVISSAQNNVARCRPLWDIFHNTRLFLCRHTMDPLNGYWFATMWCLVVLLAATPVCLKLVDYYRARGSRSSGSPTENLMISEQGTGWSSPGNTTETTNENW